MIPRVAIAVALVLVAPALGPLPASAVDLSPSEILADPDRFDGRSVTVRGTVTELRELGNAYFSFDLTDGERAIRVLSSGTPACGSGAAAAVQGVFQKVKREGYKSRASWLQDAPAHEQLAARAAAGQPSVREQRVEQCATERAREVITPLGQVRAAKSLHRGSEREPAPGQLQVPQVGQHVRLALLDDPPAREQVLEEHDTAPPRQVVVAAPRVPELRCLHPNGGRL